MARSHSGLRPDSPGKVLSPASRSGAGKAWTIRPPKVTGSPSCCAMRALIAAACRIRMRWPITAQAAASYGDQKPTGRRPG
jgi:hypothetical protein